MVSLFRGRGAEFLLLCVGLFLIWNGWQNFRITQHSGDKPLAVTVEGVESGQKPPSKFVIFGEHVRLYGEAIYNFTSQTENITYTYYPLLSTKAYADYQNTASGKKKPFSVLVKTTRWKTIPELQTFVKSTPSAKENSLNGLLVNDLQIGTGFDSKEADLIRESFPSIDLQRVLIVEEGGEPASSLLSLGKLAAGLFVAGYVILKLAGVFGKKVT